MKFLWKIKKLIKFQLLLDYYQYDARYLPNEDADGTLDLAANVYYKYETIARVKDLC